MFHKRLRDGKIRQQNARRTLAISSIIAFGLVGLLFYAPQPHHIESQTGFANDDAFFKSFNSDDDDDPESLFTTDLDLSNHDSIGIDDGDTELDDPTLYIPRCKNAYPKCSTWQGERECKTNPSFMYFHCLQSCGGCNRTYLYNVSHYVQLSSSPSKIVVPRIGFGTAGLGNSTHKVVLQALDAGYRRFDTAEAKEWYRQDLLGSALRASTIPRRDLYITTKIHPRDFGASNTIEKVQQCFDELQTEYIDVLLLHYPECWGDICGGQTPKGTWKESWRALEKLVDGGVLRCIGVSNFNLVQLVDLTMMAKHMPCIVQTNSEPYGSPANEIQAFCRDFGIQFEGYSTLGGQYWNTAQGNPVLGNLVVKKLGEKHSKTPAQIVLRWALQRGQMVIPRTSRMERMVENLNVYDFSLSDDDMDVLHSIT